MSDIYPSDPLCDTPVFTRGWSAQKPWAHLPPPVPRPVQLASVQWSFVNNSELPEGSYQPLENVVYASGPDGDGVGATLTAMGPGTLVIDGGSPAIGDRVLVIGPTGGDPGTASVDGVYAVVDTGSANEPLGDGPHDRPRHGRNIGAAVNRWSVS